MACCRRAKLALNTLRNSFTSLPILRSPIRDSSSMISQNFGSLISSVDRAKFSGFSSYSSISQRLGISSKYQYNPFLNGAKRFYSVDRDLFPNPSNMLMVVLLGSGVLITVYFANLETIPYTKRKHFVLLTKEAEKMMGEDRFQELIAAFKGKILPPTHPDSVRVRLVAQDIVDACKRGLSHDQIGSDLGYASPEGSLGQESGHETMAALSEREGELGVNWSHEDEIVDDKWIQQSRKETNLRGVQWTTSHLDGLNWEVLVINEPEVNAFCLPGGKIVVFTGLLEHLESDAELAIIIGHEVGHVVARHVAEVMAKNCLYLFPRFVLYQFIMRDPINTLLKTLLTLTSSPKMEMEADYIGLFLMASAGYDPRVALKVPDKFGKLEDEFGKLEGDLSWKKRAQSLAQAQVMEEALMIYRKVRAGHVMEDFLQDF